MKAKGRWEREYGPYMAVHANTNRITDWGLTLEDVEAWVNGGPYERVHIDRSETSGTNEPGSQE